MPGLSRVYVAGSVPVMAALSPTGVPGMRLAIPSSLRNCHAGSRRLLYSMPPSRCCSSVNEALKSALKSLPDEDAQGKLHPIRRLYACTFASGARDTAESETSWLARCTAKPLNPSAIVEQVAHPAV